MNWRRAAISFAAAALGLVEAKPMSASEDYDHLLRCAVYSSVVKEILRTSLHEVDDAKPVFVDVNTSASLADSVVAALLDEKRRMLPASVCFRHRTGEGACLLGPIMVLGPISFDGKERAFAPVAMFTRDSAGACGYTSNGRAGKWEATSEGVCKLYPRDKK